MSVRGRLLGAGFLVLLGATLMAVLTGQRLALSPAYVPVVETVAAAGLAIAATGVRAHHPFPRLGPANVVTLVRGGLLAVLAGLAGEVPAVAIAWTAVVFGTTIAVLDGVDGFLARRTNLASAFGARFDMELDAVLMLVLSILVWRHGKAGAWVLLGGLLRYLFVLAGWLMAWMRAPLSPTMRAKTVAVIHMVGVLVALGPIIPWPVSAAAAALTTGLLVWSFAVDVRRLWRGRNDPQGVESR